MEHLLLAEQYYIPIMIEEDKLFEGAAKVLKKIRPQWKESDIVYKIFTDGITNKLIACYETKDEKAKEDVVLVRVYGNKTDLLIDRKVELRNMQVLHKEGLAPRVYAVFDNGISYEYIKGETLNIDNVTDPKIWKLVAHRMATMHKVSLDEQKVSVLWDKLDAFLETVPQQFSKKEKQTKFLSKFGSLSKLRYEYKRLKNYLTEIDSPIVFAHNDLLLGNVIYNEAEGKVSFIDFEYAGYNYQAFDIANHFAEFAGVIDIDYSRYPSKDFQRGWLREYLLEYQDGTVTDAEVETLLRQVGCFIIASHFFWGIWALIQYEFSNIDFDFLEFAVQRIGEYYNLKDKVYNNIS